MDTHIPETSLRQLAYVKRLEDEIERLRAELSTKDLELKAIRIAYANLYHVVTGKESRVNSG